MTIQTTPPQAGQSEHDTTEGQGQPVNEGAMTAPASDPAPSPAPTPVPEPAPTPPPPVATAPTDDVAQADMLQVATEVALADAKKPIQTAIEDLFSPDPAKEKARAAIVDAYRKALGTDDAPGDLRTKYAAADDRFLHTARGMEGQLDDWIARVLNGPDKLKPLFEERQQVGDRLAKLSGTREAARLAAQATAKNWADRYADWASPGAKMLAQIAAYADQINKLDAQTANRDLAILSFWFEVAPLHLQLRNATVADGTAPGLAKLTAALPSGSPLLAKFKSGKDRDDGSLYLLDPADGLTDQRKAIVAKWTAAAGALAAAEASYKLIPDDAASLKARFDKVKGDGWIASAKALLDTPAA